MNGLRRALLFGLGRLEGWLDWAFTPAHNPMKQLGALGILFFAVTIVTGVHLFIGFDTSVSGAYASVENLSVSIWFVAGVTRSLHRYASDALVLVMLLHVLREFAQDRYRGARWFSWVTGIAAMLLVYGSGIGGYWLIWDELAQFIAIVSMEFLDWLPIFGEPIAGTFVAPDALNDRFFTLLIFLHIALPLMLALVLWLHLQRISRPAFKPPWRAAAGAMAMLVVLSVAFPALSQPPADLAKLPASLGLDWFYLAAYPLMDRLPRAVTWGGGVTLMVLFAALPWLPPLRRRVVAVVDLNFCNGCGRCNDDCPYNAIAMVPRTDGKPFDLQAVVNSGLCVGCGICVGACPPSTPFRTTVDLHTGIDLPEPSLKDLRAMTLAAAGRHDGVGPRVLVFACAHGATAATRIPASVTLPCVAMLPPSFIDFALSRNFADGVMLAGCDSGACHNRFGERRTTERLAGQRDPRLRARVDRARVAVCWAQPQGGETLAAALTDFKARLVAHSDPKDALMARALRWLAQAAILAAVAAFIGALSVLPAYTYHPGDMAFVRINFSHGAPRSECKRPTQAELTKLPPKQRRPNDCPRGRSTIVLKFELDGAVVLNEMLPPSGLSGDGPSYLYKGFSVRPGSHRLHLAMRDNPLTEGFDYTSDFDVVLSPRQNLVVDFNPRSGGFRIR